MTATEFWSLYYGMPITAAYLAYPSAVVEHVTLFTLAGGLPVYGEPQALTQGGCREFHGWAGAEVQS